MTKTNVGLIALGLIIVVIILIGDLQIKIELGEDESAEGSDLAGVTPVVDGLSLPDQAIYDAYLANEGDLTALSDEGLDFILSPTSQEPESETWICVPNLVTNLFHDGLIRELTTALEDSGIKINSVFGWKYYGLFD